ncbi:protein artichoke-like [Drosophila innubila]|uniref:protein artichoke-like n=1 Tax=Drosophila innubila TaxID=198719 RepID=UPI00148C6055|nr:protein artichoke-like [Drosophila innubila]
MMRSEPRLWPIFILIIGLTAGESVAVDCPVKCKCLEFYPLFYADCTYGELSEYPNFDSVAVTELFLSGNKFKVFPRQYSNLKNLSKLSLDNNHIDKLGVDALKGFNSLVSLLLDNNRITSWEDINASVSITKAPQLSSLSLRGNRLGSFNQQLFSESLETLDISECHISTANLNFNDQLPKLTRLWMANNNLSQLDILGLNELDKTDYPSIGYLDLSGNRFNEFPRNFSNIKDLWYLDLSNNHIDKLDSNALKGFYSLRNLMLANNLITSWEDINASVSFTKAPQLETLSLRGNRLGSFNQQLFSETLETLDISDCHISNVNFDFINQLPRLQDLSMANTNLSQIKQLPHIWRLDLSNCSLQQIDLSFSYYKLNLSHNPALQLNFNDMDFEEYLELDLSYCNLDKIDFSRLRKLHKAHLQGNALESINANTFANNIELSLLDLSENSISVIENNSFNSLINLYNLNLANNKIVHLNENLISGSESLAELNLSHNKIQKLTKIISNSVEYINMSWCNISTIEINALSNLSVIEVLDLSHNLINNIPNEFESNTLTALILSNCRLSSIRHNSFQGFPKLTHLLLDGNRLTSPIDSSYFRNNPSLEYIYLADNIWTCDGQYPSFPGLHEVQKPKIMDYDHLRCISSKAIGIRSLSGPLISKYALLLLIIYHFALY